MNLEMMLGQALDQSAISRISQSLGTDEATTAGAVQVALPLLLGALARNSSTPEGSWSLLSALDRDHDGSVLDDMAGFLSNNNAGSGLKILGHVFGNRLGTVQEGVSRGAGIDPSKAGQLLALLAPIVMGVLGRAQRQRTINAVTLPTALGAATRQMGGSDDTFGVLSQLLDRNNDGSAVDDVVRMASN